MFMDHDARACCADGRAAFITGRCPLRAKLSALGLPGARESVQESDPTLASMLKTSAYATAQFGKNHLGDRGEQLPANHGLDELYAILYRLNSDEYPVQF